jgi:hypothetical protein
MRNNYRVLLENDLIQMKALSHLMDGAAYKSAEDCAMIKQIDDRIEVLEERLLRPTIP